MDRRRRGRGLWADGGGGGAEGGGCGGGAEGGGGADGERQRRRQGRGAAERASVEAVATVIKEQGTVSKEPAEKARAGRAGVEGRSECGVGGEARSEERGTGRESEVWSMGPSWIRQGCGAEVPDS